jgi:transcriptional regulator with XRE-family HTH domain
MLGQKLKELWEEHQFVQLEVAAKLEVDTAYVSKMENGIKQISRNWLPILTEMFEFNEEALVTLWIADKALGLLKDEPPALKALPLITEKLQRNNS